MREPLRIHDATVAAGQRHRLQIPIARLPTETWLSVPIEVLHGQREGPCVWLSGAVHGDELNGVDIIRQVLEELHPQTLRGTLIAVPIVNVFGVLSGSRYLPDRRDLNRSFPGSPRGSLASRLAHLFMREVVERCTHGIDLHTGSHHRNNLPQIRGNLHDAETRRCAMAFGAPVMMHSETRDGSLREAATGRGVHMLLYEAGEPSRFDPQSIRLGVDGILRVLALLNMHKTTPRRPRPRSLEVTKSSWIRARRSGILRLGVELGQRVQRNEVLGVIADAFGDDRASVVAPWTGLVIGHTNNPMVNQGDALVNLAQQVSEVSDA